MFSDLRIVVGSAPEYLYSHTKGARFFPELTPGSGESKLATGKIPILGIRPTINNGYIKASDGSLTAIGTAAEPIVFTSARAEKNAGDWAGLLVYDNSILRHCVIEYAGGDYTISGYTRALTLGGTAIIEDCLIQESSGTGMEISGGSATIRNNIIKNCADMGIEIGIQYHQIVDASNTMENTGGFDITGGGGLNTDVTLTKR
ncbi:MAG: right-handed parallel beta-helix repeat-containing protein, partial [Chryseosolibacter sp.]